MSEETTGTAFDGLLDLLRGRRSIRRFLPDPVAEEDVRRLLEAARWAPSCMNEQPWCFRYAVTPEARARVVETLSPRNQEWAAHAPVLAYATCRTTFAKSDRPNRHAGFDTQDRKAKDDCGVAWGTALGGTLAYERGYRNLWQNGRERISPLSVVLGMNNAASAHIAIQFGLGNSCLSYTVACASASARILIFASSPCFIYSSTIFLDS